MSVPWITCNMQNIPYPILRMRKQSKKSELNELSDLPSIRKKRVHLELTSKQFSLCQDKNSAPSRHSDVDSLSASFDWIHINVYPMHVLRGRECHVTCIRQVLCKYNIRCVVICTVSPPQHEFPTEKSYTTQQTSTQHADKQIRQKTKAFHRYHPQSNKYSVGILDITQKHSTFETINWNPANGIVVVPGPFQFDVILFHNIVNLILKSAARYIFGYPWEVVIQQACTFTSWDWYNRNPFSDSPKAIRQFKYVPFLAIGKIIS